MGYHDELAISALFRATSGCTLSQRVPLGKAAMAVNLVVAVTDKDWFDHLRLQPGLEEINFWSPSPKNFRALEPGELFLFKLHAPHDMIVGGGIFGFANIMPLSLAWQTFGEANGAANLIEMRDRILRYRDLPTSARGSIEIGCRILAQPFFWPEELWLRPPASWSRSIVTLKTFSTDTAEGVALWDAVQERGAVGAPVPGLAARPQPRWGEPTLIRPRLGQGGFRLLVTGLYDKRCAVTRERTLPALEAAHIRPYAEGGEHVASNGILLRRDLHSLFDAGYVTVTPNFKFEVSGRIREEFENGKDYYGLQGRDVVVPRKLDWKPDMAGLEWHNNKRFLG
jgi:putative restriction endonuclease